MASASPQGAFGYHLVKKVTLDGEGFWDYLAIDSPARHLFITHSTHVMVVDADSGKVVGDIPDTQEVHGVVCCGRRRPRIHEQWQHQHRDHFDLKTLQTIGHAKTGKRPDGIMYDPA